MAEPHRPGPALTGPARGPSFPRRFLRRPAGVAGLCLTLTLLAVGLLADRLTDADPQASAFPAFQRPSRRFPMGTNAVGQDLFSRVVHGVTTSLVVVGSVTVLATVIGVALGAVAGYRGGVVDGVVMRVVEVLQAIPGLVLAIVVVALLGAGYGKLILLLALTSWTFLARLVRAQTLSVKRREFVESARAAGASNLRIVLRHVLPNLIPAVVVVLPLMAARLVLVEAGLAFLGLGDPQNVSLGLLIAEAQRDLRYYWWLSVFPGLALGALVLGLNLVGDALNDTLGPAPPRRARTLTRRTTWTRPTETSPS